MKVKTRVKAGRRPRGFIVMKGSSAGSTEPDAACGDS